MKYDITKPTAPEMPSLNGNGLEAVKLMLSQTSKDMHEPLVPMFSLYLAHMSALLNFNTRPHLERIMWHDGQFGGRFWL